MQNESRAHYSVVLCCLHALPCIVDPKIGIWQGEQKTRCLSAIMLHAYLKAGYGIFGGLGNIFAQIYG